MDNKQGAALRKRQQINQANKVMFLWIAGVSAIVGIALVLLLFLVQQFLFNNRVIAEKNKTVSILQDNIKAVDNLPDSIRLLNTNDALNSVKVSESATAVQTVLDALPADANSTAMASSLQLKLLTGVSGVSIESISVNSAGGGTDNGDGETTDQNQLEFTFAVSATKASDDTSQSSYDSLRQVLARIERSIRAFDITSISIEGQGDKALMTVSGVGYYSPVKSLQLTDKVIK